MNEQRSSPGRLTVLVVEEERLPVRPPHLLGHPAGTCAEPAAEGEWVFGLTKVEAEQVLDWLEANGYPPGELDCRADGFAVRCPGFRAYRDPAGAIRLVT